MLLRTKVEDGQNKEREQSVKFLNIAYLTYVCVEKHY